MEEKLLSLSLRDGRNALKYVQSLRPEVRQIATEAILECSRLGYPLNDMEITAKLGKCSAGKEGLLYFASYKLCLITLIQICHLQSLLSYCS